MTGVALDIEGDAGVVSHLDAVAERTRDARPAMRKVRSIIEAGHRKQFETGGAYLGDSWEALAPGTLARKARKGQDSRILRASGALEASLTGGKGRRGGATRTTARAGTSVWYAVFAKSGTKHAGHGASSPVRTIVGLTTRDRLKSVRTIQKYILTGEIFP